VWRFVAWRLAAMVITVIVALTLVFFGMALIPGDASQAGLGQSSLTAAQLAARRAEFGLDRPIGDQYLRYISGALRGDFGVSWMSGQSVSLMISQQVGPSIVLTLSSLLIAVVIGLPLGIGSAVSSGIARFSLQTLISIALSTPVLVSGTILVLIFAVSLLWLPATGQGTPAHLLLPATAIGLNVSGSLARALETGLIEARSQQFAFFARAKGLTRWQALWRHLIPVSILPVVELLSLQAGYLFGGAVVTENLFARQGLGRLLVAGILNKDVPLVLGVAFVSIVFYCLLHLLVDLCYAWLDPRIRSAS
jgi:ABC-type dipeptide/oligopeptide/nickel transport system permease component